MIHEDSEESPQQTNRNHPAGNDRLNVLTVLSLRFLSLKPFGLFDPSLWEELAGSTELYGALGFDQNAGHDSCPCS
ncbi:hypothetical protein AFLA_003647 [Aspergillus flavus NRRL3357]|nr:hypothetical protein AFLA_003647 [Aspergillus flavus NRRL3357]